MKTELIDVSPTRKEIKIEIDADLVKKAYDQTTNRYAKAVTVPGFRKGHAPASIVRNRFKDEISGEVVRELVPQAVNDAILEFNLAVLGEPDIHLDNKESLEKFGAEPLGIHVHAEVLPEVQLGEYKGLEAQRRIRPINDEDVDRVIEGLRESAASLQPVEDRASETGDTVTVNFDGRFTEEPDAEHITVDDVEVELGGPNVQPEFNENLMGVRPDDEKVFTVKYPEDFTSKGLAGKEVEYTGKVTAVRRKELPEVDDEFATSLGEEYDSVATLRVKIREDLENRVKAEAENRLRGDLIGMLVERHQIEVPATLLEHQTRQLLQAALQDMMSRGLNPRDIDFDWMQAQEQLKGRAEYDIRSSLLLEAIAEEAGLDVSNEEIQTEIEALAAHSGRSQEQVSAALTQQGGERSIADRLRNRKALDLLVENARVTDAEWVPEAPEGESPTAAKESTSSGAETDQQAVKAEGESA
jgi:trigger factor